MVNNKRSSFHSNNAREFAYHIRNLAFLSLLRYAMRISFAQDESHLFNLVLLHIYPITIPFRPAMSPSLAAISKYE